MRVHVELQTYSVCDGRQDLAGWIRLETPANEAPPTPIEVRLRIAAASDDRPRLELRLTPVVGATEAEAFSMNIADLPPDYYRLHAELVANATVVPSQLVATSGRVVDALDFVLRGDRVSPAVNRGPRRRAQLIAFVRDTVDRIMDEQGATTESGAKVATASDVDWSGYHSVDTFEHVFWFPEPPLEVDSRRIDLAMPPLLRSLAEGLGETRYAEQADAALTSFLPRAFDKLSGLGYFFTECDLDIVDGTPLPTRGTSRPTFKPTELCTWPEDLWQQFWDREPARMLRMARAAYVGNITDPERMDYNRFCYYGFDDRQCEPSLPASADQLAFASAGAALVFLWGTGYARAGDDDLLQWATALTNRWRRVRHAESGLIPEFFRGLPQAPCHFCGSLDAATAALGFLRAAGEFRKRAAGVQLADALQDLAVRLARGIARYGYDRRQRLFHHNLNLDGSPRKETARYTFTSAEEKASVVAQYPALKDVAVFRGYELFGANYWERTVGAAQPLTLARIHGICRDRELLDRLRPMADDVYTEWLGLTGEFTKAGQWTCVAVGRNVQMLLHLHDATNEPIYRDRAREMIDTQIDRLATVEFPHWWRLRQRHQFLRGVLDLAEATTDDALGGESKGREQ